MKRKVVIKLALGSWLVYYVDRKKGQRYTVGQFYAKDFTREQVIEWIKQQANLELLES